jgi:hypothetical protein
MRRVIERYLAPTEMHVVVVEDPAQLAALNYEWPPPIVTK